MENPNDIERAVLNKLFAGADPVLAVLSRQCRSLRVSKREHTVVGFYVELVGSEEMRAPLAGKVVFGDVLARVPGLAHEVDFIVYLDDGMIVMLEGVSVANEELPAEIRGFELFYRSEERDLRPLLRAVVSE